MTSDDVNDDDGTVDCMIMFFFGVATRFPSLAEVCVQLGNFWVQPIVNNTNSSNTSKDLLLTGDSTATVVAGGIHLNSVWMGPFSLNFTTTS